jgi:hypothetical protein
MTRLLLLLLYLYHCGTCLPTVALGVVHDAVAREIYHADRLKRHLQELTRNARLIQKAEVYYESHHYGNSQIF